jgi:SAM-dependent methyltransferase
VTDRAEFIRSSMRQTWATRTRIYGEMARSHAAHTEMLIAKARLRPGESVLDVATGPGVVALAAARAVGPSGRVVATDLAPEWSSVVDEACAAAGIGNVMFRAMGAEALDLADDSFDVALCQFGLMFVPNPVRALREMRRMLRDGGRLGVVVWSTAENVPCFSVTNRVLEPYMPAVPPEERLPAPTELGEPGVIDGHVEAAGFRDVAVERHTLDVVYEDAERYARMRMEMGPIGCQEALERLASDQRERLYRDMLAELEKYRRGDEIRLPSEAVYVTAVK